MTTQSANKPRVFVSQDADIQHQDLIAADTIFEGSAVGDDSNGYARPLVAGDAFLGFALEKVDNSLGGAGDKAVKLRVKGRVKLDVAGLARTDLGVAIYASDDDTFTKTSTDNTYIGRVCEFLASGKCLVEFDAHKFATS